nr:MAG TPA: hypothetical protein [Caudoviricetes sp.]
MFICRILRSPIFSVLQTSKSSFKHRVQPIGLYSSFYLLLILDASNSAYTFHCSILYEEQWLIKVSP